MKVFLLALFVAAAVALPTPLEEEEIGEPVDLIINGIPEGEPVELGDVIGIKVQHHIDGQIATATDLLHPLTAQGLAEAAAAAALESEPAVPEIIPEPVLLPEPAVPEVDPEPVILPEPVLPEIDPEPVLVPEPAEPEVDLEPVDLPAPELPAETQIAGEIYNDGLVSVKINGVLSTVQSWFNMALNYFNGDVQTTHQIV